MGRMILPKILPLTLGAAAIAAAIVAPTAGAAATPKITAKYTYLVSVKGTQKTTWTYDHVGQGTCDANQNGSGAQTVKFRSATVKMHTFDGLSQPFFFTKARGAAGELQLALRGTVNRQGSITTGAPTTDNCADGVGGPVAGPDCGTKAFKRLMVKPKYEFKKDRIVLEQGDASGFDLFQRCPNGGDPWPYLLKEDTNGRSVGQNLPYDDLFKYGKNILIANATYAHADGESKWTTKIHWELTFKRIKKEKLG
jgi:hypothetical protein